MDREKFREVVEKNIGNLVLTLADTNLGPFKQITIVYETPDCPVRQIIQSEGGGTAVELAELLEGIARDLRQGAAANPVADA